MDFFGGSEVEMQVMTHDYSWLLVVTGTWLDYDFPIILGMENHPI